MQFEAKSIIHSMGTSLCDVVNFFFQSEMQLIHRFSLNELSNDDYGHTLYENQLLPFAEPIQIIVFTTTKKD